MFTWLSFINACFFLTLSSCLLSTANLFQLLLAAEMSWISLYSLTAIFGVFIDDAGCFSLTFFILGFAAIELCFGLLVILLMKHFKLSIFLTTNSQRLNSKIFSQLSVLSTNKLKI